MVKGITFDLSSQAVARGVHQRTSANLALDTLDQIRKKPLLAPSISAPNACECNETNCNRLRPGVGVNLKFVPPPMIQANASSSSSVGVASAPPQLRFTFNSLVTAPALKTVDFTLTNVTRFAPAPVANIAGNLRSKIAPAIRRVEDVRCEYVDQYSVGDPDPNNRKRGWSRFWELVVAVLCKNVPHDIEAQLSRGMITSRIIGRTGHYERFAALSHILGFAGFAIYALIRSIVPIGDGVAAVLVTVAAWTTASVFLASTLYHCTSPDPDFAAVTRVIDYTAIYLGIVVGGVADLASATNGFDGVPVITIVDIPIAGVILALFFIWRRVRLSKDETWISDYSTVPIHVECTIGRGLYSKGHSDLHHTRLREASTFLITTAIFMSIPVAYSVLGVDVATVFVVLQSSAFLFGAGGMFVDRVLQFPNNRLIEGKSTYLACPKNCGCAMTAHGLWHLIAILGAACTIVAREYALSITK